MFGNICMIASWPTKLAFPDPERTLWEGNVSEPTIRVLIINTGSQKSYFELRHRGTEVWYSFIRYKLPLIVTLNNELTYDMYHMNP